MDTRTGRRQRLQDDVAHLAGTIGHRDTRHPKALQDAASWIEHRFRENGLLPRLSSYTVEDPCTGADVLCHNIEADPGEATDDDFVLVGAHYDSPPGSPGADDNATGVAALLEIAHHFARAKTRKRLRCVAFVNEEPPWFQTQLMGSWVYAAMARKRGDTLRAMIALESLGYYSDEPGSQAYPPLLSWFYPDKGNFLAVVGNWASRRLVGEVARLLRAGCDLPVEQASLPSLLPGVGWSDHWSFWREGYEALMITDTAAFRSPHYHRATDTPANVEFERFTSAVEGIVATVEDLVSPP